MFGFWNEADQRWGGSATSRRRSEPAAAGFGSARPGHVDGDLARTRHAMAVYIGAGIAEETVFRERRCRHMEKPRPWLSSVIHL